MRWPDRCVLLSTVVAGLLLAACGGSGKPAYCSSVSNLESSIKALPSTDVITNGVGALKASVAKVKADAQAVVNDAKNDFPNEANSLKTSVDALVNSANQVVSSPSVAGAALIPGQVSSVVNAVNSFKSATSSKCG